MFNFCIARQSDTFEIFFMSKNFMYLSIILKKLVDITLYCQVKIVEKIKEFIETGLLEHPVCDYGSFYHGM